jgi:hypothetical protein
MAKQSTRLDGAQVAALVAAQATHGEFVPKALEGVYFERIKTSNGHAKNAAAVALGRLGASKGGHARAKALTKEQIQEIGRKGAEKRWSAAKI